MSSPSFPPQLEPALALMPLVWDALAGKLSFQPRPGPLQARPTSSFLTSQPTARGSGRQTRRSGVAVPAGSRPRLGREELKALRSRVRIARAGVLKDTGHYLKNRSIGEASRKHYRQWFDCFRQTFKLTSRNLKNLRNPD